DKNYDSAGWSGRGSIGDIAARRVIRRFSVRTLRQPGKRRRNQPGIPDEQVFKKKLRLKRMTRQRLPGIQKPQVCQNGLRFYPLAKRPDMRFIIRMEADNTGYVVT